MVVEARVGLPVVTSEILTKVTGSKGALMVNTHTDYDQRQLDSLIIPRSIIRRNPGFDQKHGVFLDKIGEVFGGSDERSRYLAGEVPRLVIYPLEYSAERSGLNLKTIDEENFGNVFYRQLFEVTKVSLYDKGEYLIGFLARENPVLHDFSFDHIRRMLNYGGFDPGREMNSQLVDDVQLFDFLAGLTYNSLREVNLQTS